MAWGNVPTAANGLPLVSIGNDIQDYTLLNTWHCGVVVITTAQIHSKHELRFLRSSNPDRVVSEIRDGEDL